jgi:hypothetical protein
MIATTGVLSIVPVGADVEIRELKVKTLSSAFRGVAIRKRSDHPSRLGFPN